MFKLVDTLVWVHPHPLHGAHGKVFVGTGRDSNRVNKLIRLYDGLAHPNSRLIVGALLPAASSVTRSAVTRSAARG